MALTAPYGIREGGRKLGSKKDTVWEISEEMLVVFFFLICLCNDIIVVIFFWYDRIEDVDNINLEILSIFFYSSRDEHIPAKRLHTLSSIIVDLLEFSFKYLVVGGRLVYWLPVYKPRYAVKLYFYNDVYITSDAIHNHENIAARFHKNKEI